jgi:glyceraldehyde 3-phosphate dehydrogenase
MMKVAINGFGRMGKLGLRAGWHNPAYEIVHINEISSPVATAAHLLSFDSVHGTWDARVETDGEKLIIEETPVSYSSEINPADGSWGDMGIDLVIDCTGKHKTAEKLAPYFEQGVKKVLVSSPVPEPALNVVYGVNHDAYDPDRHDIVTAASCTTNCLAPVIKVIHEKIGIRHACMTTIHNITNTQTIIDKGHSDLRRARACGSSLIPTTTGSAKAITKIFPELEGRINGLAVRVPLTNASLTDLVIETERRVTEAEVNSLLQQAAADELQGILGYEERPLVSVDYTNDTRSAIIDADSTMVINGTQLKLLVWYDNEWGYVNRMMELAAYMAKYM